MMVLAACLADSVKKYKLCVSENFDTWFIASRGSFPSKDWVE